MAGDALLVEPLTEACMDGAAAWWSGRPERYRVVRLETGPAESERCMVAGCSEAVRWSVRGESGDGDDYARVCEEHRGAVEQDGDVVSAVE